MLVMEMSRKEQQIPAIRFNGFTDAWEQRKLNEIFDYKQGQQIPIEEQYDEPGENRKRFIRIIDLTSVNEPQRYIVYSGNNLIHKNDIFMVRYGKPGIAAYGYEGVIANNLFKMVPKELTNTPFYYTLLTKMRSKLENISSSTTMPALNFKSMDTLVIIVPNIDEQEKIGTFFKQLDNTIDLHQRQVNNYKLLKNSLIQQMFPQGGEQLPKMRFAGFSGEWVRKKLGEFVEINRGLTYKPEDVVSDGIRVLRSSNIKQDIFELRADDVFVRHDAANIPEIKNGDILVTSANGSTALVGKHAIVDKLPSKTVHGGFMLVIRCEHNYFINTWMSSSEYKRVLQLVQGGNGAIGNLSKKVLEEAVIAIPSDEEQTKIGNFFKKLDDNITFHQQKTDDYQQLKKVLLQQMFL